MFTTVRTPLSLRESAGEFAQVEVVPSDVSGRVDLLEVMRRLLSLGVRHLLLEGGGELNFSMLQAGLIDEVYLTICPFIFGGRTGPTSFDGAGLTRDLVCRLGLKSQRVSASGEVFLHYDVLFDEPPRVSASRMFPHGFDVS